MSPRPQAIAVLIISALLMALPCAGRTHGAVLPDTGATIRARLGDLRAARADAVRCSATGDRTCLRARGRYIVRVAITMRRSIGRAAPEPLGPSARVALHQQIQALTEVAMAGRALVRTNAGAAARVRLSVALKRLARSAHRRPVDAPAPELPGSAAAPPGEPDFTFTGMSPAFSADAPDYGIRCTDGYTSVTVNAPAGSTVEIAGRGPVTGARTTGDIALSPGRALTIAVTAGDHVREYHARCLPDDFPTYATARGGSPQAEWFITTPDLFDLSGTVGPYAAVFDAHGAPVWWQRMSAYGGDAKLLPDGTLAWWVRAHDGTPARYEIRSLNGTLLRHVAAVGVDTDNHDLQVLPNGNVLLLAYVPRAHVDLSAFGGGADATVLDSEIQEVRPDGSLAWSWNSSTHMTLAESAQWIPLLASRTPVDLIHLNSLEAHGDSIVVSARHADAVYSVNRSTGAIEWKLGGTVRSESLGIVGDSEFGAASFGGQHDARILPDGTLTVFDNGTHRQRAPRALRYRLDTGARTATLIEEIRDSDVPGSGCCGSARRLTNGDWVMGWGMSSTSTENAPDGTRVFGLTFGGGVGTYRTIPVEPGVLARSDLRAAMDQMPPS